MHRNTHRAAHEIKRGVLSPRLVRMLGADARMSANDEPDFTRLCDECETVAHCLQHGCIPKVQQERKQ